MSEPHDLRTVYELAATAPMENAFRPGEPGIYVYDFTPEGVHKWQQRFDSYSAFWICCRCGRQACTDSPLDLPSEGCPAKLDLEEEAKRRGLDEP